MPGLAHQFAGLSAELRSLGDSADAALGQMVQLAVEHVPGCAWASVSLFRHRALRAVASSDPVAARADQVQHDLIEGPSLQAAREQANYMLLDVEQVNRWPRYSSALLGASPIRSVLSFGLPGEPSAVLSLYSNRANAFDLASVGRGGVFAAHISTAVALYEAETANAEMKAALTTNRQIGIAIGVLMSLYKVTRDDAFILLRGASQRLHIKLRDLARDVAETGVMPAIPIPRATRQLDHNNEQEPLSAKVEALELPRNVPEA